MAGAALKTTAPTTESNRAWSVAHLRLAELTAPILLRPLHGCTACLRKRLRRIVVVTCSYKCFLLLKSVNMRYTTATQTQGSI